MCNVVGVLCLSLQLACMIERMVGKKQKATCVTHAIKRKSRRRRRSRRRRSKEQEQELEEEAE